MRWWNLWRWVLLGLPFVALLWTGSYNRSEPTLAGIPFFYWYQLAWVPLGVLLLLPSWLAGRRERRQ